MDPVVRVQLWMGIFTIISLVWGFFAPLIIEVLSPMADGIKKALLVALYCVISAIIVVGVKNGFQINWQSMTDIATLWLMLVAETKIVWEAFWRKPVALMKARRLAYLKSKGVVAI
jgi:hypothetical protein